MFNCSMLRPEVAVLTLAVIRIFQLQSTRRSSFGLTVIVEFYLNVTVSGEVMR